MKTRLPAGFIPPEFSFPGPRTKMWVYPAGKQYYESTVEEVKLWIMALLPEEDSSVLEMLSDIQDTSTSKFIATEAALTAVSARRTCLFGYGNQCSFIQRKEEDN